MCLNTLYIYSAFNNVRVSYSKLLAMESLRPLFYVSWYIHTSKLIDSLKIHLPIAVYEQEGNMKVIWIMARKAWRWFGRGKNCED